MDSLGSNFTPEMGVLSQKSAISSHCISIIPVIYLGGALPKGPPKNHRPTSAGSAETGDLSPVEAKV
jgi:hypothetical protein